MDTTNITGLQEAIDNAAVGLRDREKMREASDRLDKLRETVKARVGIVNVAVDFVREARECD